MFLQIENFDWFDSVISWYCIAPKFGRHRKIYSNKIMVMQIAPKSLVVRIA